MLSPAVSPPLPARVMQTIERLLGHERLMSLGVNRPDGWPQVSTVGYIHDGLDLSFVTGRESQKLANLQADARVSVSIHSHMDAVGAVGLSMAGRAVEVSDPVEIERLNRLLFARWPSAGIYCPATTSIAIVRVRPHVICAITASGGRSRTECFSLAPAETPNSAPKILIPGPTSAEARLF